MIVRMSADRVRRRYPAGPGRNRRRGTIMLETVFVVSVSTVLLGMAAMTIHHLLTAHSTARDAKRNALMRQRLVSRFRQDCRESDSVEMVDGACRFKSGAVTWTIEGDDNNVVIRSWDWGKSRGSDRFYSTRDWSAQFAVLDGRAKLTLTRTQGGSRRTLPGKVRKVVAEASVGTDDRLRERLKDSTNSPAGDRQ